MCWDRVIEAEAVPQTASLPAAAEPVPQPVTDEVPALAAASS